MGRVTRHVVTFLGRADGVAAVEYAAFLALVAAVCVVALTSSGPNPGPLPAGAGIAAPAGAAN